MLSLETVRAALGQLDRSPLAALTIDVEWAHPAVLADVVSLLDERGLQATFFCTHAGIEAPGHELALHPNFFRTGNSIWRDPSVGEAAQESEQSYWRRVVEVSRPFCPEARGVRSHGLFAATLLWGVYAAAGLEYDSSTFLPLAPRLQPVWLGSNMLELPIHFMDHWDLRERATGFSVERMRLDEPGLKILDFHPNLIYANYSRLEDYSSDKDRYHDPEALLERRRRATLGCRDLFLRTLDRLAAPDAPKLTTLGRINEAWRTPAT